MAALPISSVTCTMLISPYRGHWYNFLGLVPQKILQSANGAVLDPAVSFYHWTPGVGPDAYCVVMGE